MILEQNPKQGCLLVMLLCDLGIRGVRLWIYRMDSLARPINLVRRQKIDKNDESGTNNRTRTDSNQSLFYNMVIQGMKSQERLGIVDKNRNNQC